MLKYVLAILIAAFFAFVTSRAGWLGSPRMFEGLTDPVIGWCVAASVVAVLVLFLGRKEPLKPVQSLAWAAGIGLVAWFFGTRHWSEFIHALAASFAIAMLAIAVAALLLHTAPAKVPAR